MLEFVKHVEGATQGTLVVAPAAGADVGGRLQVQGGLGVEVVHEVPRRPAWYCRLRLGAGGRRIRLMTSAGREMERGYVAMGGTRLYYEAAGSGYPIVLGTPLC